MDQGINYLYLYGAIGWIVVLGIGIAFAGIMAGLVGLRVIGPKVSPEITIEWMQRWVALTRLERWTLLWGYVQMEKEERAIFRQFWIEQDCRVYSELSFIQSSLLSAFGGAWLIKEIALSVKHPEWMSSLPRPSSMPVVARPVTFVQLMAYSVSDRMFSGGVSVALVGMVARVMLRRFCL